MPSGFRGFFAKIVLLKTGDVGFAHLHGVHERSLYNSEHEEIGKFRKLDAYIIGIQGQYRF